MHSIYKYPLEIKDEQVLELPIDAKILSVVSQKTRMVSRENPTPHLKEELVLYSLITTNRKFEKQLVDIKIIGTGHRININDLDGYTFLNTVQQYEFMWHVFYKKEKFITN